MASGPGTLSKSDRAPLRSRSASDGRAVLIVDDDPIVRGICRMLLGELGFEVFEAEGGNEAVSLFSSRHRELACVILDFAMPDQDGNLTLVELRELDPQIPVLVISGYQQKETIEAFAAAKPNAFLHKPFNKKQFATALFRAIDGRMPL